MLAMREALERPFKTLPVAATGHHAPTEHPHLPLTLPPVFSFEKLKSNISNKSSTHSTARPFCDRTGKLSNTLSSQDPIDLLSWLIWLKSGPHALKTPIG